MASTTPDISFERSQSERHSDRYTQAMRFIKYVMKILPPIRPTYTEDHILALVKLGDLNRPQNVNDAPSELEDIADDILDEMEPLEDDGDGDDKTDEESDTDSDEESDANEPMIPCHKFKTYLRQLYNYALENGADRQQVVREYEQAKDILREMRDDKIASLACEYREADQPPPHPPIQENPQDIKRESEQGSPVMQDVPIQRT
ncbi:unnamed protein product [Clonostachys rosea]|uniref:Uncharacterized protein n=1 Tax=Bionectria ochroleuca TaxID=29856 RepID=A0ABY6TSH5_BIOOC|nr:unnamed protein product [Clonostachys rosea]